MTSEEFWRDDPKLFSSYRKAYIEKEKREFEIINQSSWIQGLYIYDGLKKSLADLSYNVWGKNNPKSESYLDKPIDLTGKREEKKVIEREKVRKESQKNLNFWARIKK